MIAVGLGMKRIERAAGSRTKTARARGRQGLRRAGIMAVMAVLALSAVAAPAAASSTYDWSLSCKGNGSAVVSWTWISNGASIATGGASCEGDEVAEASGAARPDGANEISVTVLAAAGCGKMHFRTVSESFSTDGAFKVGLHVSSTDNVREVSCSGHFQERAAFMISG